MNRKPSFVSFLLAALTLTACGVQALVTPKPLAYSNVARNVIIDTDMAMDDWIAILYILQRPDINVLAITVSGTGEAHCKPGELHALELLQLAGRSDVAVACGKEIALGNGHEFPAEWRQSVDELAGLELPDSLELPQEAPAHELLSKLISEYANDVAILTLGPLTNLADALSINPDLAAEIEMVYTMGGAITVGGNVTANSVAEWNVYADPLAAQMVLDSGVPLTLIPLDATNYVPVTSDFYHSLESRRDSPEADFVYQALTQNLDFIATGDFYFWDPLAAVILGDETIASFESMGLTVLQDGTNSGQTVEAADGAVTRVATWVNQTDFENVLLTILN